MKHKALLTLLAAVLLAGCSSNRERPARAIAYDCYDGWPYVYYSPHDCWYPVWYGPAYYYYPYRTYYGPAATGVGAPRPGDAVRRTRERLPLPDRDRDPLPAPQLPRSDLPVLP